MDSYGVIHSATRASPPAGTQPPSGVLTKLKVLSPSYTQVTDAGCAALAAALQSGALPALETLHLYGIPASAAAKAAVQTALVHKVAADKVANKVVIAEVEEVEVIVSEKLERVSAKQDKIIAIATAAAATIAAAAVAIAAAAVATAFATACAAARTTTRAAR